MRIELMTPGLQDQCSNHWATEARYEWPKQSGRKIKGENKDAIETYDSLRYVDESSLDSYQHKVLHGFDSIVQ